MKIGCSSLALLGKLQWPLPKLLFPLESKTASHFSCTKNREHEPEVRVLLSSTPVTPPFSSAVCFFFLSFAEGKYFKGSEKYLKLKIKFCNYNRICQTQTGYSSQKRKQQSFKVIYVSAP